ncbi:MAG: ribonuclease R family protein, partial [Terriglobales bacterium]
MPLEPDRLLRHIERQPHRRATFKQLLRELGIKTAARREFKAMLAELVRERRLIETRHHFELPAAARESPPAPPETAPRAAPGEIAGRISVHRDGFAFVLPRDSEQATRFSGDIFIPPPFVGSAMHGDTVAVRVLRRTAEGRGEGKVTRILRRAHATVVGEFRAGRSHNVVAPFDDRLRDPIVIPRGQERPEGAAQLTPHRVLGAEARPGARAGFGAITPEALDGLVVDAAITQYPTPTSAARGRVVEILGHRDDFGIDVEIIIRKYHLPHRFPDEVLGEAAATPQIIAAAEAATRRDFRAFPVVTIDGESARDFDDAVHVRALPDGEFELQVHIADVTHYVAAGSAMDREARLRGTSVYFPDRAVPMLPVELSTDLCSLRPEVERLTLSCVMRFDGEGRRRGYEIVPGIIRSAARMTYTEVNAILQGDEGARRRHGTLAGRLPPMLALQKLLYRRRMQRGSIDFDLPEPEIAFDEFGLMRSIVKSERNIAHRIIEEFMLAANETVAGHLERLNVASIYRIHEKPDARKVAEFEEIAASFGYSLDAPVLGRRLA